jgi:CheY-like chemotaxis protein
MSALKLKVLVADDSAVIHSIFADIAEHSPIAFDIIRADNGRQCEQFLKTGGVNVAFIDVNMPDISGMEAVGVARQLGNKTFVALMSVNANERRLQLARQLKVYEYLEKPFTADDVVGILHNYCRVIVPSQALIVDDSATVRRIIQKVLRSSIFNIDVAEAGNGSDALELCENGEFDVIFLDCNMPGLNGMETLERLLERDPGVRVVMISGERNEERKAWALKRGAVAFLHKPFYATDVDRELHALYRLKMPMLADVEPLSREALAEAMAAKAQP